MSRFETATGTTADTSVDGLLAVNVADAIIDAEASTLGVVTAGE